MPGHDFFFPARLAAPHSVEQLPRDPPEFTLSALRRAASFRKHSPQFTLPSCGGRFPHRAHSPASFRSRYRALPRSRILALSFSVVRYLGFT